MASNKVHWLKDGRDMAICGGLVYLDVFETCLYFTPILMFLGAQVIYILKKLNSHEATVSIAKPPSSFRQTHNMRSPTSKLLHKQTKQ